MALRFQEPSSASCAMELTSACNVHQDLQEMKDRRPDVETQHINIFVEVPIHCSHVYKVLISESVKVFDNRL